MSIVNRIKISVVKCLHKSAHFLVISSTIYILRSIRFPYHEKLQNSVRNVYVVGIFFYKSTYFLHVMRIPLERLKGK